MGSSVLEESTIIVSVVWYCIVQQMGSSVWRILQPHFLECGAIECGGRVEIFWRTTQKCKLDVKVKE